VELWLHLKRSVQEAILQHLRKLLHLRATEYYHTNGKAALLIVQPALLISEEQLPQHTIRQQG
jgi:hypothetical protein